MVRIEQAMKMRSPRANSRFNISAPRIGRPSAGIIYYLIKTICYRILVGNLHTLAHHLH